MLSRSFGQVAYVLRDRSPLGIAPPLDLHFLGTPQAFVLSQDQTLHQKTDVNPTPKRREIKQANPGPSSRLVTSVTQSSLWHVVVTHACLIGRRKVLDEIQTSHATLKDQQRPTLLSLGTPAWRAKSPFYSHSSAGVVEVFAPALHCGKLEFQGVSCAASILYFRLPHLSRAKSKTLADLFALPIRVDSARAQGPARRPLRHRTAQHAPPTRRRPRPSKDRSREPHRPCGATGRSTSPAETEPT